jgi:hypothetical protein
VNIMLVIRRTDGQWVEVTHKSGDKLRFRVYDLSHDGHGRAHLAFHDPERNFLIQRPERAARAQVAAAAAAPDETGPAVVVESETVATAPAEC